MFSQSECPKCLQAERQRSKNSAARGILFILMLFLSLGVAWASAPTVWRTLAPGLSYAKLGEFVNFPEGYIHAFKIDLNYFHLKLAKVVRSGDLPEDDFQKLMLTNHAVLVANGGFFTPELQPLGLRITDKNQLNPAKDVSWWDIFFVKNNHAYLTSLRNYHPDPEISFAIQAGPRLVSEGKRMPGLNTKADARTALGITAKNEVILLTTENLLLSTVNLADVVKKSQEEGGLGCIEAINLDGGHSAQIYASLFDFSLTVASNAHVADAVLVISRIVNSP